MDNFNFLDVVEGDDEGYRELELNSSIKIVDAGRSSPVDLAEDDVRLREVDRDLESAARVAYLEKLDESLMVDDEENQFSGHACSTSPGDVFEDVAETP